MNQQELLEKVAEQYRGEGYTVRLHPIKSQLPEFLRDEGVDMVAEKGDEHVAIQAKARGQLYDIKPLKDKLTAPTGWRFEIVVYPQEIEEIPQNGKRQSPRFTASLIEEGENLLNAGSIRAAFIIAWSALEAAMREIAFHEKIETENVSPRFIVKSLYSGGLVSREDFERIGEYLSLRNDLVHGFEATSISADAPQYLLDVARRLLNEESAKTGP